MSGPHFYQGDPSLVDDIIGLHPRKDIHGTFLDVEPVSIDTSLEIGILKLKTM